MLALVRTTHARASAAAALAAAPANQPLPALLEQLAAEIADPGAADDMVLLAARIPAARA